MKLIDGNIKQYCIIFIPYFSQFTFKYKKMILINYASNLKMIQPQKDPLRFLKPRKKNFHLTPPKNINKDANNSFSTLKVNESKLSNSNPINPLINNDNQKTHSNTINKKIPFKQLRQDIVKNKANQQFVPNKQEFNFIQKNDSKIQTKSKKENRTTHVIQRKKTYQAYKYFSSSINQFLLKSKSSQRKKPQQQIAKGQRPKHTANDDTFNFESQLDHNLMIPLKQKDYEHEEINQTTMRVEDYFYQQNKTISNSNRSKNTRHAETIQNEEDNDDIRQNILKVDNVHAGSNSRQGGSSIYGFNKGENNIQTGLIQQDQGYQQAGLMQCQTCGRSFNPISFQKHSKVCQKVFFKKRKQFSSQKQRSKSKNK